MEQLSFFNEKGQLVLRVTGEYAGRELGAYLDDGNPAVFESFPFSDNDTFLGSKQDDYIFAGARDDQTAGLGGHDEIYGGAGMDLVTGGLDNDIFFSGLVPAKTK